MQNSSKPTILSDLIQAKIEQGQWPNQSKLPSYRQLSKLFSVSTSTVRLAFDLLEKSGLVARTRGSGVYVQSKHCRRDEMDTLGTGKRRTNAETVADDIVSDIAEARIKVGTFLPLQKNLQFKYRVSRATIRSALKLVVQRGLIHRKGSAYFVGGAPSRRPTATRVYFIDDNARHVLRNRIPRTFFTSFEDELGTYGTPQIHFPHFTMQRKDARSGKMVADTAAAEAKFKEIVQSIPQNQTVGFVYSTFHGGMLGLPDQEKRKVVERELAQLAKARRPVVIFNDFQLRQKFPNIYHGLGRNFFPFYTNDSEAGESVGTYLATMGHRAVAYFSFYSDSYWNKARYQGLQKGLAKVHGKEARTAQYAAMYNKRELYKRNALNLLSPTDRGSVISTIFAGYHFTGKVPAESMFEHAHALIQNDICQAAMEQHFARAFKRQGVTAWVCADPQVAVVAKLYLARSQVPIPGKLSLVTIDDDEYTSFERINAYNFQYGQMGYLAAHCFWGDIPIRKCKDGYVDCPGRMIERGSVKRP